MKIVDTSYIPELNLEFNSYESLISYYKTIDKKFYKINNVYVELHHIIPKCEGGSDDDSNLILLNFKHHILAHYLRAVELEKENNLFLAWKHYTAIHRMLKSKTSIKKSYLQVVNEIDFALKAKQKYLDLTNSLDLVWITDGRGNARIPRKEAEKEIAKNPKVRFGREFSSPKGKIWITDGINRNYLLKEDAEKFLKENPSWKKGMGKTKEHEITKDLGSTRGLIWVHKGDFRKNIRPEELEIYLKDGFKKGTGNSKTNLKKKTIHKGNIMKNVPIEKLQEFLNDGWTLGRTQQYKENCKKAARKIPYTSTSLS